MHAKTAAIYVMTVGTGTAGTASNLAKGLEHALLLRQADRNVLVPSQDEDSRLMAQVVREACPDLNVEIAEDCFSDHDDLLQSRREFRGLLARLADNRAGNRIIVNPTSGTKQMTTAAVLAAVDCGIADIEYISGPRQDGVVKTGHEKITAISPRRALAYQTGGAALRLLEGGAYRAAAKLVEPYSDLLPLSFAGCETFAEWHRFNYRGALTAAGSDERLRPCRQTLGRLAQAPAISIERAADMICFADRELSFGHSEEAFAVLYRLAELLAKLHLQKLGVDTNQPTMLSNLRSPTESKCQARLIFKLILYSYQKHFANKIWYRCFPDPRDDRATGHRPQSARSSDQAVDRGR